jgi:hypothetical protein
MTKWTHKICVVHVFVNCTDIQGEEDHFHIMFPPLTCPNLPGDDVGEESSVTEGLVTCGAYMAAPWKQCLGNTV